MKLLEWTGDVRLYVAWAIRCGAIGEFDIVRVNDVLGRCRNFSNQSHTSIANAIAHPVSSLSEPTCMYVYHLLVFCL